MQLETTQGKNEWEGEGLERKQTSPNLTLPLYYTQRMQPKKTGALFPKRNHFLQPHHLLAVTQDKLLPLSHPLTLHL